MRTIFAITWWDRKLRLRTDNHSLVWLMSFKEPQGHLDALSRRPRRQHGNCPSCTPTGLSQVTVVARDLPVGETPREVRNCWYPLCTWYLLCRLLKEWRKPAVEEPHVDGLCCSCSLGLVSTVVATTAGSLCKVSFPHYSS